MLAGIPPKYYPTLKRQLKPYDELEDFRRYLIDCEQGLRPWMFDDKGNPKKKYLREDGEDSDTGSDKKRFSNSRSNNNHYRNRGQHSQQQDRKVRDPPSPCECGGMHWRSDCPKGKSSGFQNNYNNRNGNGNGNGGNNRGYSNYKPNGVNSTHFNANNNRWNQKPNGGNSNATANTVNVRSTGMKTGRQRGFELQKPATSPLTATIESIEEDAPVLEAKSDTPIQDRYMDVVPTYAKAYMNKTSGPLHEVCIDTGSGISLVDLAYYRKHLSHSKMEVSSTIQLDGVGSNTTHGWVELTLYLLEPNEVTTCITAAFHVVSTLATPLLIGNDILVPQEAVISLADSTAKFRTSKEPYQHFQC
jgi:hypothetical protein